jgi:hypothetical protein
MNRLITNLLAALTLLTGATMARADAIEFIQLYNKPAQEMIPVLRPLLDAGGSLSGTGFQLIVRTSADNLAQLKRIIARLDTAPRQLLISVYQGSEQSLNEVSRSLSIGYHSDDIRALAGPTVPPAVSAGGGRVTVAGSAYSTRADLSDNPIHQLRVLEGSDGYIETGQTIPIFSGHVWHRPGPDVVEGQVDYRGVMTGFYVRPRVAGREVILDINPYRSAPSDTGGGAVDTQSAATRLRGELGRWIEIGGVQTESVRSRSTLGGSYQTRDEGGSHWWIRADTLP